MLRQRPKSKSRSKAADRSVRSTRAKAKSKSRSRAADKSVRSTRAKAKAAGEGARATQLLVSGEADPVLHLIEVVGEGAAAGGGETVLGAGNAGFEKFQAGNVFGFFEFAGVDAEVAVGGFEDAFEVVEAEAGVGGESADNSEPDALVDQAVEFGELESRGGDARARGNRGFGGLAALGQ